jgi:acyl dehydratase
MTHDQGSPAVTTPPDLAAIMARLAARVGRETAPTVTEIEKGAIRRFALATGDTNPLYFDEEYAARTRFGGIIAPPTFISTFVVGHIPEIFDLELPLERTLHSDDTAHQYRPIRPGERITAFARFAGAVQKTGKQGPMIFQSADLILTNQDSAPVAEIRIVSVCL